MRWPFGPPHLTLNPPKKTKNKKKEQPKTKKKKEGGFRAKWGGPLGHLTWPLNPPKKHKNKKINKENKRKNKKKKQEKKKPKKNSKNTQKLAFQLSVKFFLFWVAFQNFPFFDTLAQKARTQKHYKNRGFRTFFFGKQMCVTKRPFLDQKNQNS